MHPKASMVCAFINVHDALTPYIGIPTNNYFKLNMTQRFWKLSLGQNLGRRLLSRTIYGGLKFSDYLLYPISANYSLRHPKAL